MTYCTVFQPLLKLISIYLIGLPPPPPPLKSQFPRVDVNNARQCSDAPALAILFLVAVTEVRVHAAALTQVADMLGHLGHGRQLTVHAACLPTGHLHTVCPRCGQCCHLGPLWTSALLTVRG